MHPKNETVDASTPDMNVEVAEKFNTQTFTQGSASFKKLYYNPSDLKFQQGPVRERERERESYKHWVNSDEKWSSYRLNS